MGSPARTKQLAALSRTSGHGQGGLSLVELMVAMALSLLIVMALTGLFVDVSRSNAEMAKTNTQIENARFAMQFLRNDLIHAGYWNAHIPEFDDLSHTGAPTDYPTAIPAPCAEFDDWDTNVDGLVDAADDYVRGLMAIPLQAYDSVPSGCTLPNYLADTDVLLVRHAQTCAVGDVNCDPFDPNELYFTNANCYSGQINAGINFTLDPNSPVTPFELDCATPVAPRRYVQSIYYIRDYAVDPGDAIPTLVRSEFGFSGGELKQQPAQALVEGIERFRVELGLDRKSDTGEDVDPNDPIAWADEDVRYSPRNRGDGVPESFVHCEPSCALDELTNVVAVKLFLLARATEVSAGYADTKTYQLGSGFTVAAADLPAGTGFKRHAFSSTVRLNNVSGRRETPP
ncbi:pilus assembly protein PilW [Mangrovimicrobium sediminis]|uniref:Pilus assembly protein PilW n=2 Tax=Mangrovimicrobium sediminis TaxID=2562682 RepID=A0A4Z0LWI9_9GAMM|nr:pilus assembly protein PilW [Haliea sp. SAOS-164]